MSVRTMARVWEFSQHGGTNLLMELAIADFSDDEGRAYPSVPTLAKKCRISERQAVRVLKILEDSGELKIQKNTGPRGTNVYRLMLRGMTSASPLTPMSPLTPASLTPDIQVQKPLTPMSPEPPLNHQETPVSAKPRKGGRSKSEELTFAEWHVRWTASKAEGERFLRDDDPLHTWAAESGISYDFLNLAFRWFSDHFTVDNRAKKHKDWRATFRRYVREDYCRLWTCRDGVYRLNAKGKALAIRHGEDPEMTSAASSASRDWTSNAH